MAMTTGELDTLASIAAAVRRIEDKQQRDGERLDRLERFADRAEGAITLAKFTLSILGISGIAAIIAAISRGNL